MQGQYRQNPGVAEICSMIYHCFWIVSSDLHSNCLSKEGRGLSSIFVVACLRSQACSFTVFHTASLRPELTNSPVLLLKNMRLPELYGFRAQHIVASYAKPLESTWDCIVLAFTCLVRVSVGSDLHSFKTWTWFIQRVSKTIWFSLGWNMHSTTLPWKQAGHCLGVV